MSDEIQRSLGRIEGKLDSVLEVQKTHAEKLAEHEALKNKGFGIFAAVAIAAGTVSASLTKAITSWISPVN